MKKAIRQTAIACGIGWLAFVSMPEVSIVCQAPTRAATSVTKWSAMSETAMTITGDVYTTDSSLLIHNRRLTLRLDKRLDDQELKVAADLLFATINANTKGELYKTYLPSTVRLQGSNTLCGKHNTTWILIVHTIDRNGGVNLDLAAFSGTERPVIQTEALDHSTNLCGTYWYQK